MMEVVQLTDNIQFHEQLLCCNIMEQLGNTRDWLIVEFPILNSQSVAKER